MNENKYFAIYSDILGFSDDMTEEGSSFLFDYCGAILCGAELYPSIRIYLFSDSVVAFVEEKDVCYIPSFLAWITSQWSSDALLYQCFVGYGTFIEGRANWGFPVRNFFGAEIHGTALVDAAKIEKSKPLGSRIIVSELARKHLPQDGSFIMVEDKSGYRELFLQEYHMLSRIKDEKQRMILDRSNRFHELNCFRYLLEICKSGPNTGRKFKHQLFSVASCAFKIGESKFNELLQKAAQNSIGIDINVIFDQVRKIVDGYKPVVTGGAS